MEDLNFEITNVSGVEHAEIILSPGVNVLRGRNAIGKTSARNAIVRAQGGEAEIERRDGSDHGEVIGPGVRLRVGKVVTRKGEAEVSLADTAPLSTLIDPGLKDTDAAARARVRALIELLGVGVDDAAIETLCQGDAPLLEWLTGEVEREFIDDLMVAAEKLRGHAHSQARDHESQAEEMAGRSGSARDSCRDLLAELGGMECLVDQSAEDASAALVEGSRRYERAAAQCQARETLEAQQSEIRRSIGERPDCEAAGVTSRGLGRDLAEIDAIVTRHQEELAAAKQCRAVKQAEVTAQKERVSDLAEAAERWDTQQATLAQIPDGPNRERLPALEAEFVDTAQKAVDQARRSEAYRTAEAKLQESDTARNRAAAEASRLRSLASALPSRLGDVLASAGAKGLTVIGGRLHAIIDGQTLDWEHRLSDGQRARAALDIAAQAYTGVVPIAGVFWASLDPDNQAAFAAMAKERGLYAITEEPAEGELRVEHVGEETGQ